MAVKIGFGTDGIRGLANIDITPEFALRLGQVLGTIIQAQNGGRRHRVVIGKDTRLSGYMVEYALVAGFVSVGVDPLLLGPMPTFSVAMLTRSMRADLGIMITASHNMYEDNGIKIFNPDGSKLSDETKALIERMLDPSFKIRHAGSDALGRADKDESNRRSYVQFAKMTTPRLSLEDLRIVVDCANGACYKSAPEALSQLGAEVISIGVAPDGFNINRECGSTSLVKLKEKVREMRADVGIAFDGDADRVIFIDEEGKKIDGDQLIAVLARSWQTTGRLSKPGIVGTLMTNVGLERHLNGLGIALERTDVGDHNVLQCMREKGFNLGGESSGHIIMILPDLDPISDGLITALQVLDVLLKDGRKASEVLRCFDPVTQTLRNIEAHKAVLQKPNVISVVEECCQRLVDKGRLVVRASGTEPVIRVMVECNDIELANHAITYITKAIRAAKE